MKDIEPYLGARGHLVALREGDLAFLHVHPESEASEGSDIRFAVEYPSEGRYRLFLQFKLDGARPHRRVHARGGGGVMATEHLELPIAGMTCASCAAASRRA